MSRVMVVGYPGSGNHLLKEALGRIDAVEEARIEHCRSGTGDGEYAAAWADGVIQPVRADYLAWCDSADRRGKFARDTEYLLAHRAAVAAIVASETPFVRVIYEDIVDTGGAALDAAIRRLGIGLEPAPWPDRFGGSEATGPVMSEPMRAAFRECVTVNGHSHAIKLLCAGEFGG